MGVVPPEDALAVMVVLFENITKKNKDNLVLVVAFGMLGQRICAMGEIQYEK